MYVPVGLTVVVVVEVVDVVGNENGLSGRVDWASAGFASGSMTPLNNEAKSILTPPACARSLSMEIGVVETVGHPVNSVVALNLNLIKKLTKDQNRKKNYRCITLWVVPF